MARKTAKLLVGSIVLWLTLRTHVTNLLYYQKVRLMTEEALQLRELGGLDIGFILITYESTHMAILEQPRCIICITTTYDTVTDMIIFPPGA